MELILASKSVHKASLLDKLQIDYEQAEPRVREVKLDDESPSEQSRRLAIEKATEVAQRHPGAFVIGADQVIARRNTTFSKPGNMHTALQQLMSLAGSTHQVHTSVCICSPSAEQFVETVTFEMEMRRLTETEALNYLKLDQPLNCAGSYMIESFGVTLFRKMTGDDYTAVVGLPLTRVRLGLEELGFYAS